MKRAWEGLLLVTSLLLVASHVLAQSANRPSTLPFDSASLDSARDRRDWRGKLGAGYELSWWTMDGGGRQLTGGAFTLLGTAGQPDADTLTGGHYTLAGGFWGAGAPEHRIYLPLVVRND